MLDIVIIIYYDLSTPQIMLCYLNITPCEVITKVAGNSTPI